MVGKICNERQLNQMKAITIIITTEIRVNNLKINCKVELVLFPLRRPYKLDVSKGKIISKIYVPSLCSSHNVLLINM